MKLGMELTDSRQAAKAVRMRAAIALVPLLAALALGDCGEVECDATEQKVCPQPCLSSELCSLKARVQLLENDLKALPKVAFSVSLRESGTGNLGPFEIDTAIKFKKIFANIGNCYNPSTGIFTAMVRGVYYFRFTSYNNLESPPSCNVVLMKNGERTVSIWDKSGQDTNDSASNAVVLQLEVGDNVFVRLLRSNMIFDDLGYYNTFSGFLLFPV